MVKIEVFDTFLRKSTIMVDFDQYDSLTEIWSKWSFFHTFSKEKYRDSRKQGDFDPHF